MLASLKRVLARGPSPAFCECRHCGTTVDRPATGCPACESGEIVCYDV